MNNLIKAANDALKSLEGYRRELQGYVGHGGEQQCDAEKALRQALAETEGMCIVPIEPTDAMCKAGFMSIPECEPIKCDNQTELYRAQYRPVWKAMLSVANEVKK